MKGYLFVRPVSEIARESKMFSYSEAELLAIRPSLEGLGWIPLTSAIKQGSVFKVSAEKHGTHYEARFDTGISRGDNGLCQICGCSLACVGTFVNVWTRTSAQFKLLFVCHSSSGDGRSLLQWWIGVNEIVDAENLSGEE